MKKIFCLILVLVVIVLFTQFSYAAEHGGKEHGGEEHKGSKGSGGDERASKEHGGHEHGEKEHGGEEHASKEHGGKEHGGEEHASKEHGGEEHKGSKGSGYEKPTADNIRSTMKDHVLAASEEAGTFNVDDPEMGKTRRLALVRVHERVGKTGDYYYSCADFTDVDTGELLDLDLDVEHKNGRLGVVDVRIHKLDGNERYTYDENDNRIPIE
jgi:hypothetical protein